MYKLNLEKAEEPEIKLPTLWIIQKSRKLNKQTKKATAASLTMLKLLTVWIKKNLWNILNKIGISDHITCLLRNLYAGQEATITIGHGTMNWFQIGKGVHQGCIVSPYLFNLYVEYIMQNAGWMKHKLEARLPEEISITADTQMILL